MKPPFDLSVYLVADPVACGPRGVLNTVVAAVAGGATLVQLRDKQADDAVLIRLGRELRAALAGSGARLLVNDRVAVAAAIGADGVHLGQNDTSVTEARACLGSDAIIGYSARTPETARAVDPALVDYLGVGPVFATATKPDHAPPLGFAGLAAVCAASPLPVVAIGGLQARWASEVRAAGACGLAVVAAICAAADPAAAARALTRAVRSAEIPHDFL